jgi:DNA repair protein RadC
MDETVHKDHRQRMLQRVLRQGLDQFEPHQALEVLLYFAVPRQDTNPLAHRLIDHFGSLAAVLDAQAEDLMRIPGVGERTAIFLSMMPELFNLYRRGRLARTCCWTVPPPPAPLRWIFSPARPGKSFICCA